MINVLIVDEESRVADLYRLYVNHIRGFRCYAHVSTSQQARQVLIRAHREIDLVLLSMDTERNKGADLLATLGDIGGKMPIILLSPTGDFYALNRALVHLPHIVVDHLLTPLSFSRLEHKLTAYREKAEIKKQRKYVVRQSQFHAVARAGISRERKLPKGLTSLTLSTVCNWIKNNQGKAFSTKMMSDAIGISSVSCRKYLNYLSDTHILTAQLHYGTAGRPMYLYRLLSSRPHVLQ